MSKAVAQDGRIAGGGAGVSVLRTRRARKRRAVSSRRSCAIAACSCGPSCWRSWGSSTGDADRHRQRDVHHSRRARRGAGPPDRILHVRSARADRRRRSAAHRPDRLRQPRALSAAGAVNDAARLEGLTRDLRIAFSNTLVTVRSYRNNEDRVGEQLQVAENYLGLVGYVMVVLGGIGVWSVTRVFIQQKLQSIAVLKCVGATVLQVLGVYVVQVLLLGAAGSLMGLGLGALMLLAAPTNAFAALGAISVGLTLSASLQAFGIGVLVSLLFALVPLLEVRRVRPLLLLREETSAPPTPAEAAAAAAARHGGRACAAPCARMTLGLRSAPVGRRADPVVAVLVLLASWQAASWRVGGIVSIGFVLTAIALHLVGLAVVRLVRPLGRRAVVSAASRGQWARAARSSNQGDSPGRRPRRVLHPRRAAAADEPDARILRRAAAGRAGHVPDRRAAGSVGSAAPGARVGEIRCVAAAAAGAARARHRRAGQGAESRVGRKRARARQHRPRVHGDLSRSPAAERADRRRHVLAVEAGGRRGSLDRARHARSGRHPRRRHRPLRHSRPPDRSARHERPRSRLERFAQRRLRVRVPSRRARTRAARLRRDAARARPIRPRGRACSATSWRSSRTSR